MPTILMIAPTSQKKIGSGPPKEKRSGSDRRGTMDRRKNKMLRAVLHQATHGALFSGEQRSVRERRYGWFRIGKWNSSCLNEGA